MYKVIPTRKHGLDIFVIVKDKQYVTCFMSDWMATTRAYQLQAMDTKAAAEQQEQQTNNARPS
jgi:hypothetical protein